MKTCHWQVSTLLVICLVVFGFRCPALAHPSSCDDDAAHDEPVPATQPAVAHDDPLDRVIPELQLQASTLEIAFDQMRDATHANIVVDWPALQEQEIQPTNPVRLRLWDVTLRQALAIVLEYAGGKNPAGFTEKEGIITVSTAEKLSAYGITRIYDIRGLIKMYRDRNGPPAPQPTSEEATEAITKLIEDIIATDSWKDNGGNVGALREFNGLLVITQTAENQKKVEQFLVELRAGVGDHFAPKLEPSP